MINDTISNPTNSADDFCNVIINTSNDIAKDIGVTYGELWTYTTFLVIGFYRVLYGTDLCCAIYQAYQNYQMGILDKSCFYSCGNLYPNGHHVNAVRKSIIE
jgi:hypothetical protein